MATHQCSQTRAKKLRATETLLTNEASAHKVTKEVDHDGMTTLGALKLLIKQARELKEYFSYFVTAKTDSVKLRLRNSVLWMLFAALGFVALSSLFITAGWFLLTGLAGGLGVLFGNRLWIGNIVTGVLVLAGLGLGMYCAVVKRIGTSRNRTIQSYEERQSQQQSEFGNNVREEATNATARH